VTRAPKIPQGAGIARARARRFEASIFRDRVSVRAAPTVVRVISELADGHDRPGPIDSALDGTFEQPRKIAWRGANAAGYQIRSMIGEVDVMASSIELHFVWNLGYIEGEAQSGGKVIPNENRPRFAYVLPPGTRVGFRLKQVHDIRQLSVELQPEFVRGAAGFEPSVRFDVIETWDYGDLLSWQLARVIYGECASHAPQGALYAETAATLLAMHLVRNLSTVTPQLQSIRRGGLPPSRLRRGCDYMMSRLGEDISLQEVAASVQLSTGHFATAFKQSLGVAPHAWLRCQRIEQAKRLFRDPNLDLTQIAFIVGYANQSSFGVAFKRETGLTPMQWRMRDAV
jgi:AraC family transcriptional regulator